MTDTNSYEDAFYAIAKELGFDYAQSESPKYVFEKQILPLIRRLKAKAELAEIEWQRWRERAQTAEAVIIGLNKFPGVLEPSADYLKTIGVK